MNAFDDVKRPFSPFCTSRWQAALSDQSRAVRSLGMGCYCRTQCFIVVSSSKPVAGEDVPLVCPFYSKTKINIELFLSLCCHCHCQCAVTVIMLSLSLWLSVTVIVLSLSLCCHCHCGCLSLSLCCHCHRHCAVTVTVIVLPLSWCCHCHCAATVIMLSLSLCCHCHCHSVTDIDKMTYFNDVLIRVQAHIFRPKGMRAAVLSAHITESRIVTKCSRHA